MQSKVDNANVLLQLRRIMTDKRRRGHSYTAPKKHWI